MIVYNEEEVLERSLGALASHFPRFVIADMGSTDRTRELAKQTLGKRLQLEHFHRNRLLTQGYSVARNHCASHAKPGWILMVDADEILVSGIDAGCIAVDHLPAATPLITIERRNLIKPGVCLPEGVRQTERPRRLYRADGSARWTGYVHEELACKETAVPMNTARSSLVFDHVSAIREERRSHQNRIMYRWMLLRAYRNPKIRGGTNGWWYDKFVPENINTITSSAREFDQHLQRHGAGGDYPAEDPPQQSREQSVKSPILIMSFNRPDYLAKVLDSLRSQADTDLGERQVVLFQDGAVNPYSGRRHATDQDIEACIHLFQKSLPRGTVMASPINLGVALNFDRAEKFAFDELKADAAIFLEDDMVLGPHYLTVLEKLLDTFYLDERVGYLAAYGAHLKSVEEQRANKHRLILLYHNWGFGLYRRQWLRMRPRIDSYLEIIKTVDYVERDHQKIRSLFASWGYGFPASSQDTAKTIVCCMDGVVKINTYLSYALYIGERGVHMSPDEFARQGYANAVMLPEKVTQFQSLDDNLYQALLKDQRNWALRQQSTSRRDQKATPATKHRGANSPTSAVAGATERSRQTEEAFVRALYRILLMREPDLDGLAVHLRSIQSGKSFEDVMRTFMRSGEFQQKSERFLATHLPQAAQLCTATLQPAGAEPLSPILHKLWGVNEASDVRAQLLSDPVLASAAPELRLAIQIGMLRRARATGDVRLIIGAAGTYFAGWVPTDQDLLDLLKPDTWRAWLEESSVTAIVAEHVWEHLDEDEGLTAARTCYSFLAPGKHIRIAVPDAFKPDPEYHELCKVGGRDGHKVFYDYKSLSCVFRSAGFTVTLLEYWDEKGEFHENEWSSADGHIGRSRRFDRRNKSGGLVYTSLIADALKPPY